LSCVGQDVSVTNISEKLSTSCAVWISFQDADEIIKRDAKESTKTGEFRDFTS
jgi:hypothetical protein